MLRFDRLVAGYLFDKRAIEIWKEILEGKMAELEGVKISLREKVKEQREKRKMKKKEKAVRVTARKVIV
jgi:hypothetical protein